VTKAIPALKTLILIIAVIFGGLAVGKLVSDNNAQQKDLTADIEAANEIQENFENADYIAAPPTFGPIIQTTSLDVIFSENAAVAFASEEQAQIIEARRSVILYDTENYVLPLGGKVESIEEKDGAFSVRIKLPQDTNTEFLSNQVDVITKETIASKRVPLSALQEQAGLFYVWVINQDNNNNTVEKLFIDVGLKDEEYFEEEGEKIETFTPIIINPDDKIEQNKGYNIFQTEIAGPIHNPIRQAWMDYELYRLEADQKEMLQKAEDCKNGSKELILEQGASTNADGSAAVI